MRIRNHWVFICSFKDCKDVNFPVLQALRFIGLPQEHMTFSLQTERLMNDLWQIWREDAEQQVAGRCSLQLGCLHNRMIYYVVYIHTIPCHTIPCHHITSHHITLLTYIHIYIYRYRYSYTVCIIYIYILYI